MKEEPKSESPLIGGRSAEEILREHTQNVDLLDRLTKWHWSFVLKAMEEYASQFKAKEDSLPEATLKEACLKFFYYWWNRKGNNTEEGFDDWIKTDEGKQFLEAKEDNKAFGEQERNSLCGELV